MIDAELFHLDRFVRAQDDGGVLATALAELARGRKATHWMWFVFPQLAGLGSSGTASYYAIGSLAEARAYLAHPVLGPRLRDAADAVLASPAPDARSLLGSVDALKLRSSMTLFARADPGEVRFGAVLARWCGGHDPRTLALLGDAQEGRASRA